MPKDELGKGLALLVPASLAFLLIPAPCPSYTLFTPPVNPAPPGVIGRPAAPVGLNVAVVGLVPGTEDTWAGLIGGGLPEPLSCLRWKKPFGPRDGGRTGRSGVPGVEANPGVSGFGSEVSTGGIGIGCNAFALASLLRYEVCQLWRLNLQRRYKLTLLFSSAFRTPSFSPPVYYLNQS